MTIGGFSGKILRLNLTTRTISTIDSNPYLEKGFLGGHGLGSAVFFDLMTDFSIDGMDERNICTVMPGGLAGTIAPSVGRTEVQAFSTTGFPTMDARTLYANPWFNRSNFGGGFAAMLKFAGWDGIVIEGKASSPVWVKILNDSVTLEDAGPDGDDLWGRDTWATQEEIFRIMANGRNYGQWINVGGDESTTRRPEVVTIGPAGESLSRIASLVSHGGRGAGDGGMGSVWGSKNLKAIGVLGTGNVEVADPQELIDTRLWHWKNFSYDVDNPSLPSDINVAHRGRLTTTSAPGIRPGYGQSTALGQPHRWAACTGCFVACARTMPDGVYNDTQCSDSWGSSNTPQVSQQITQLLQKMGFNARLIKRARNYVRDLYQAGFLGPGKEIESGTLQLDFYGSYGWAHSLMQHLIDREEEFSTDLADGPIRLAAKLGRLEEDLETGLLKFPQQGNLNSEQHWTFAGGEWAYACLMRERDVNEHDFTFQYRVVAPYTTYGLGGMATGDITPDQFVNHITDNMPPFEGDPYMLDYGEGETGIYSLHKAKQVAWYTRRTRFWKQTLGTCDWGGPFWFNTNANDFIGEDPEREIRYLNAITGLNMSYADGIRLGRKIYNIDRAIWGLQGRTRDLEKFSGYMHGTSGVPRSIPVMLTVYKDGQWQWWGGSEFNEPGNWGPEGKTVFLREGVEEWKTHYYGLEGWDTSTGWATRTTLEDLDLGYVADKLQTAGKLGT